VRHIIDELNDRKDDKIIFCTVAGNDWRHTGVRNREEFARRARYEVYLNENSWQTFDRVDAALRKRYGH
jgi:CBS domain-containing membrane protein